MKRAFMIYLAEEQHQKAKDKAKDMDISLSKYISWLIRKDLESAKASLVTK